MADDLFSRLDAQWVSRAKACGCVSLGALNDALPDEDVTSEQVEALLTALSEVGVEVLGDDALPDTDEGQALAALLASFADYQRTGDRGPAEAALEEFRARFGPGVDFDLPDRDD